MIPANKQLTLKLGKLLLIQTDVKLPGESQRGED